MRKEEKIMAVVVTSLALLLASLYLYPFVLPKENAEVQNRKDALYDSTRAPVLKATGGININTADAALLDTLPGIGPALAGRIVAYREEYGPFPHPACITEVAGIGESLYQNIADKICVK